MPPEGWDGDAIDSKDANAVAQKTVEEIAEQTGDKVSQRKKNTDGLSELRCVV